MLSVTCKPYLSCLPREKKKLKNRTLQILACQHLVSLKVFVNGLLHDVLRQLPAFFRVGFQPVTGELFVKGRLAMSGLIAVYRPETGAVGSQHFISQYHIAVLIQTELELGICNNDSFGQCVIRTLFINSDGIVTKLGSIFCTLSGETLLQIFHTLFVGDVLIMISDLRLGGRGIDGLRKLICLLQTFRNRSSCSFPSRFR